MQENQLTDAFIETIKQDKERSSLDIYNEVIRAGESPDAETAALLLWGIEELKQYDKGFLAELKPAKCR